jgi:hypothetical protein
MRCVLGLLLSSLICTAAYAPSPWYVAINGTDTGNGICSQSQPCQTIQHAVDLARPSGGGVVNIGPGTFPVGGHVYYYQVVTFQGNNGGACDPSATVISVGNNTTAFNFEDHAIASLSCLTISSNGNGSTGVATRQFTIADLYRVTFGPMIGGFHVAVNEMSKLNYLDGIYIAGSATAHAYVTGMSTMLFGGATNQVALGLSFSNFAIVVTKSLLNGSGGSLSWNQTTGHSYCVDAPSTLYLPTGGFPGNLGPNNC